MPAFYNLQDQHDELDLFLYQLGKTSGGRRVAPLLDNIWPINYANKDWLRKC